MPAPQLPWFRFWKGATQHDKTRQLSDAEFRTWVELLDLASQQKPRGRFVSRRKALKLSRRPARHLTVLIDAHLVDEAADGVLTMHDWDWWQRWRKTDAMASEDVPNDHAINHRNDYVNDRVNDHVNDPPPSTREEVKKREKLRPAGLAMPAGRTARARARAAGDLQPIATFLAADLPAEGQAEILERLSRPPIGQPALPASPSNNSNNAETERAVG